MARWIAILLLVAGCTEQSCPPASSGAADIQPKFRLPVSTNEVMVALVNDAANPLWVAAWHHPETDEAWRELERRAVQMKLAGSLIAYPGTGGLDEKWAAKPNWTRWSHALRDAGADAIDAVQARDLEKIRIAGDRIVEVCEGCHTEFKLPYPTGGQYGELAPTEDDLE